MTKEQFSEIMRGAVEECSRDGNPSYYAVRLIVENAATVFQREERFSLDADGEPMFDRAAFIRECGL